MQTITKEHKWRHLPVGTRGIDSANGNEQIVIVEAPTLGEWTRTWGAAATDYYSAWAFFRDTRGKVFIWRNSNENLRWYPAVYNCWKCHRVFSDELHYLCPDCRL